MDKHGGLPLAGCQMPSQLLSLPLFKRMGVDNVMEKLMD